MPDRCNKNQLSLASDSTSTTSNNFFNDHRHSKIPYSDGKEVIEIDELKHDAYYELINFKDPCTENYQRAFRLCSARCGSQSHETETDKDGMPVEQFCCLELWHEPVKTIPEDHKEGQGYVSLGGHYFPNCNHQGGYGRYSTYLIIDRSGSMSDKSVKPSSPQIRKNRLFKKELDNCMGLVYEAVVNFVSKRNEMCSEDVVNFVPFNTVGTVVLSDVSVSQSQQLLDSMLRTLPHGGTIFKSGVQAAYQHLVQTRKNASRFNDPVVRQPVFIILSDSCDHYKTDTKMYLTQIMNDENSMRGRGLILHALGFGNEVDEEYLKEIASIGRGGYHKVQNSESMQMITQLTRAFCTIAEKPNYHFGLINLNS
eukprot:TRINITY_DN5026_c0_g1_i3.p1 TRINITY_DN5026_c0_g1~~TRINITY_DN5026_c0_g1_i3.p1  ORF type:complete len:368 (-),score=33.33 TRINITY_DN5026_c0_g1_i3:89-1192(-)